MTVAPLLEEDLVPGAAPSLGRLSSPLEKADRPKTVREIDDEMLRNEASFAPFVRLAEEVDLLDLPTVAAIERRTIQEGGYNLLPLRELELVERPAARAFGSVALGSVYHAHSRATDSRLTVVVLDYPIGHDMDDPRAKGEGCKAHSEFWHELSFLSRRKHPNLASVMGLALPGPGGGGGGGGLGWGGADWAAGRPLLLLEPCQFSLSELILDTHRLAELPWLLRVRLVTGLACGLAHLYASPPHHAPIELHSGVVLVTADFVPKLTGVRRVEAVSCHSQSANVFHLGTIMWELLTRRSVPSGALEVAVAEIALLQSEIGSSQVRAQPVLRPIAAAAAAAAAAR